MRAGNAGLVATFLIAFAGILAGAFSSYVSERGAVAEASRELENRLALRERPIAPSPVDPRDEVVMKMSEAHAHGHHHMNEIGVGERFPAPAAIRLPGAESVTPTEKPQIYIVFDDMGIDKVAFDRVMNLPGPVTLSFLPYAEGVDRLAARARARGDEIMLHLPMEPIGDADPGPNSLRTGSTGAEFLRALNWNLEQIDGVVGVNNHMGSRFTADEAAMKTTLANLKARDLFFLDSLTTSDSVARAAGAQVGANVIVRDVFIDADPGKTAIVSQLALVEEIARETGYAVAIAHPRDDTIDVIGPWLTSALARGFELAPVSTLVRMKFGAKEKPLAESAPSLRL